MAIPQSGSTATAPNQLTIEELLGQYAGTDIEKFNIFFRRMRNAYPQDCVRGCIRYLGTHSANQVSRQMLLWLCSGVDYLFALFDPEVVSLDRAKQAAVALRDADPQFFAKLARFLQDARNPKAATLIMRVLSIIPALGECGILIPWLRALAEHSDEQIRLQSAKTLCELRPTRAMVERQLQSGEPQTRADALEALWRSPGPEAKAIFQVALSDPDHRVVAKALVGLHLNQDATAVEKMIELTRHRSAMFRLAMIAAMSQTGDPRCAAALISLLDDAYPAVRESAKNALAAFPRPELKSAVANAADVKTFAPVPTSTPEAPPAAKPKERTAVVFETPAFRLL